MQFLVEKVAILFYLFIYLFIFRHQHFIGDKWDKSLKLQKTQETRKLVR